jgi:hypothetical protein
MTLIAISAIVLAVAPVADGEIIFVVTEQGNDVVFEYSGSVDLTSTLGKEADRDISFRYSRFVGGVGEYSAIHSKGANVPVDDYNLSFTTEGAFSGSSADDFGFSGGIVAGDSVLFETGLFDQIWLPNNYVSGQAISGSLTFVGTSFQELGLQPEITKWEWENNGVSDSLTVNVGNISAVPEPSSLAVVSVVGFVSLLRRRRLR